VALSPYTCDEAASCTGSISGGHQMAAALAEPKLLSCHTATRPATRGRSVTRARDLSRRHEL
jgi:hypothetical protein